MKILFFEIFTALGEIAGGDAKQICYLVEEFKKKGHELEVLNFHFKDKLFIRDIKFIGKFLKLSAKKFKADVIFASGTPFWALPTYFLGKRIHAPTVLYITHFNNLTSKCIQAVQLSRIALSEGGLYLFLKSIINNLIFLFLVAPDVIKNKLFLKFYLKRIDKIIASCEYIKQELKHIVNKDDVEVIYPLIEKNIEQVEFLNQPETKSIFYFGAFYSGRGVIDLLYAFMEIIHKFPGWKLVIAGYPKYEATTEEIVRRIVDKYNLGLSVEILGYCDDVLKELKKAFIVCIPFQDEVLFQPPLTLLEALRMGRCVISTDCGAVSEFIIDAETGFLVKRKDINGLAEKIAALIKNPSDARRVGFNAIAMMTQKCNFTTNTKRIEEILKEAQCMLDKKKLLVKRFK
jgi:glycosyltransferase involved in cell wall biosynthesis